MTGFKNRLRSQAKSKKIYSDIKELRGKELADYVKDHKNEFHENGDALCVEAGYGEYTKEGIPNCHLKPFVKELSKVMDLEENEE